MWFGHISFSAGIAQMRASRIYPGPEEFTTLGFPVEIQAVAASWAAVGLSLISNINSENSFAGVKVIIGFGSLR